MLSNFPLKIPNKQTKINYHPKLNNIAGRKYWKIKKVFEK